MRIGGRIGIAAGCVALSLIAAQAQTVPATLSDKTLDSRFSQLLGVHPAVIEAARQKATRPISEFKPSRDSFAFTNSFPGLPVKSTLLDRPGQAYGLCGGMSFAATDFFLTQRDLPQVKNTPQKGSPLWNYLFRRQIETLADGVGEKFVVWTGQPDTGKLGVPTLTAPQAEAARKLLDANIPAVLGLILTDDAFSIFSNHQILAYGYEALDGKTVFHTYDPNYPRDDNRVIVVERGTQTALGENISSVKSFRGSMQGKTLAPIRGFFVTPYAVRDPDNVMPEAAADAKTRTEIPRGLP